MELSPEKLTHYWGLILRFAHQYVGSANLGNKEYQHLGVAFGPQPTARAAEVVTLYARTISPDDSPANLAKAVLCSDRVRAAWRVADDGYYFEFWSKYPAPAGEFEADQAKLLAHLDFLAAKYPA